MARTLGLAADEAEAVLHIVTGGGCVRIARFRAARVDVECLRALARAVRDMARQEGLRL
jgi:hypothetical protein